MKITMYFLFALSLMTSLDIHAQYEKDYIPFLKEALAAETEVSVDGGRADLVNDMYAIEVEHANNWKEAIGQSLWYASPGIFKRKSITSMNDFIIKRSF